MNEMQRSFLSTVTPLLYVKKAIVTESDVSIGTPPNASIGAKAKISQWRSIFSRKEIDEERFVLLPMFNKEKEQKKTTKNDSDKYSGPKDWWFRYFYSQKVSLKVVKQYLLTSALCGTLLFKLLPLSWENVLKIKFALTTHYLCRYF